MALIAELDFMPQKLNTNLTVRGEHNLDVYVSDRTLKFFSDQILGKNLNKTSWISGLPCRNLMTTISRRFFILYGRA
jgi:hypothetical protein